MNSRVSAQCLYTIDIIRYFSDDRIIHHKKQIQIGFRVHGQLLFTSAMLLGIRKSSANISSERINSAALFWARISMDTIRLKCRTFIHGINEVMFLFLDQHFKHNLFVVFEG